MTGIRRRDLLTGTVLLLANAELAKGEVISGHLPWHPGAIATVELMLYFEDREPVGPYRFKVGAKRTLHLRFNDLQDPEPVPRDTPYSSIIRSDVPVVVQHSRLDSRDTHIALLSTVAFPVQGNRD
jgi:Anabaena sensory rhodopsin transducer